MALNIDQLGCRDSICNIDYCKNCGKFGDCLTCMKGYRYNNSTKKCSVTNCTIDGCEECSGLTCNKCMQGYTNQSQN